MADTVAVRTLVDDARQTIVHLTGISDGTGESAVVKVDKSAVAKIAGAEPAALDIEAVRWAIQGYSSVRLLWDHTTDDLALVLCGNGYEDFIGPGEVRGVGLVPRLVDPRSSGGTGDVLLTTVGAASAATYDITLWLRKAAA